MHSAVNLSQSQSIYINLDPYIVESLVTAELMVILRLNMAFTTTRGIFNYNVKMGVLAPTRWVYYPGHSYILEVYMYITPPGSDWTGLSLIEFNVFRRVRLSAAARAQPCRPTRRAR
jgi:hypothetical protein